MRQSLCYRQIGMQAPRYVSTEAFSGIGERGIYCGAANLPAFLLGELCELQPSSKQQLNLQDQFKDNA